MILRCLSRSLFVLILCFGFISLVQAEEVSVFDAHITPYEDGSFAVVENITYDFGGLKRHGIVRHIKKEHPQKASVWYKTRSLDIIVNEVQMDGISVPFEIDDTSEKISIKIGDPGKEISGQHTYTITYRVEGGMSYYDNNVTELYWNVTGHEWEVPIRQVIAEVDAGTDLLIPRRFCYAGVEGATDSCESITATSTEVSFSARNLGLGAGLTIAQEVKKSAVAEQKVERMPWWLIIITVVMGWLGLLGWLIYRWRTAHRLDESIISQFKPLEDFKPMFSGVLMDGTLHDRDITAGLLYLAEQGFISIRKTEQKVMLFFEVPDYEITLLKDIVLADGAFLQEVLFLLFEEESVPGAKILLSKLKADSTKRKENYKTIQNLKHSTLEDLTERGYFEQTLSLSGAIWVVVALGATLPFILPPVRESLGINPLPVIIVLFAVGIILSFGLQRRTKKGYQAQNHLKGFKEFLKVTGKDRYKFHNAPEKSPQQFMEYLPYAVAFGVEKEWAEVFKDIDIGSPGWYQGDDNSFNAVSLINNIGAFSSVFTGTTSSSSSGSSGGGFSGGGAGGGGGSSW